VTGTNQCLANEGFHEAMEFASGNYGLLHAALAYANDTTAPNVQAVSTPGNGALVSSYEVKFKSDEAASIYYTTDGSTPTTASTEYKPTRPRAQVQPLVLPAGTTLKWIAHDFKGNMAAVKSETFIPHVDVPGNVGGTVPATLSLSLGPPATFGAFTAGVARDYFASTTANVLSTAGDAVLSVSDPSSNATGHLVNGTYALPQPLQSRARNAANTGTAYNNVGSAATPLNLLAYDGPISNDAVTLEFKQSIGAADPLRTGTYSKTLTFTLSTTSP
jgi:hypothetical protein